MKTAFIITSAINTAAGIYPPEIRVLQTHNTIDSIKKFFPDALTILVEGSSQRLSDNPPTGLDHLRSRVNYFVDMTNNEQIQHLHTSIMDQNPNRTEMGGMNGMAKTIAELTLLSNVLEGIATHPDMEAVRGVDRIFKLSGRYMLSPMFRPEEHFHHTKWVFRQRDPSWIQNAIDELADEMMSKYNSNAAIIYNTIQLYRHDRLAFLKQSHQRALQGKYILGVKLVRGAYMEKERERARLKGYADPIQPDKKSSDADFNSAAMYCLDHIQTIHFCAGTHNEESSILIAHEMQSRGLEVSDTRVSFAQLFGMSDHISFNLAASGFQVCKYMPYGPLRDVMPYLIRRARENTSVKGQAGRELSLIRAEMKRRKLL